MVQCAVSEHHLLSGLVGEVDGQRVGLAAIQVEDDFADAAVVGREAVGASLAAHGSLPDVSCQAAAQCREFGRRRRGEVDLSVGGAEEPQVARQRVCAAELLGRHFGRILPVAHPADDGAAVRRSARPAHRGVVVLAEVHPLGGDASRSVGVGLERLAVEVADEVLRGTAAEGAAGVEVADECPFLLAGAVHLQLEEVGALPDTALCAFALAECALERPGLQVGRGEEQILVLQGMGQGEHPLFRFVVPEHVRVAGLALERDDGVARIALEGDAPVVAVGHALHLADVARCIECHHGILAEAGRIGCVDH